MWQFLYSPVSDEKKYCLIKYFYILLGKDTLKNTLGGLLKENDKSGCLTLEKTFLTPV